VDTADYIKERAEVGNVYVNRNIVDAVVSVQPFGGYSLSGNGLYYMARFAVEKANSGSAAGVADNAMLLSLNDQEHRHRHT